AGDLSALLDAMSNGVQTIQAANNGLTAMTTVVQQMQATVQQANQDSSFQSTDFSVNGTAIGTSSVKNLTFSGGNVGTTPVNVALNSTASHAVLTASTTVNAGAGGSIDATGGDITFTINT